MNKSIHNLFLILLLIFTQSALSNCQDAAKILFNNDFESNNTTHEDAEDGDTIGWAIYTAPAATITNVADNGGRVIQLSGSSGLNDGFSFSNLNLTSNFVVSWSLKYSNDFRFFTIIRSSNSPNDNIYMEYTPDDISTGLNGAFIHNGLGANANDGTWHTFKRDIEADFHVIYPSESVTQIIGFSIRGSGRIDNIKTEERIGQATFLYGGHAYEIIKTPMTWQNAADKAINENAYLANISSIAENQEIFSRLYRYIQVNEYANTVAADGGSGSFVWIGANDLDDGGTFNEGKWIWDNTGQQFWSGIAAGTPVAGLYNSWGRDKNELQKEPDNSANSQDASGIGITQWPVSSGSYGQASQWNDLVATDLLFSIFECQAP